MSAKTLQRVSGNNLVLAEGEHGFTLEVPIVEPDGEPLNLNGRELEFVVRRDDAYGGEVIATVSDIDVAGSEDNLIRFEVPEEMTSESGDYFLWCLWELLPSGQMALAVGRLAVIQSPVRP